MADKKNDVQTESVTQKDTAQVETTPETKVETQPDYSTKFSELEKKIGEQGEFIGQAQEFIKGASVVFESIADDPQLTQQVRDKISKRMGGDGKQGEDKAITDSKPSPEIEAVNQKVSSIEATQREDVIQAFEKEHGIDQLPDEERKKVRTTIGGFLNEFGWSVNTLPLQTLGSSLRKAYLGTHAEKLRDEGKLEGFTKARELENATMGSFSGGNLRPADGTVRFTDKQLKWMNKLRVDPDKAKKTLASVSENT